MSAARAAPRTYVAALARDMSEQAADHFNNPETSGKLWVPNARDAVSRGNPLGFHYASMEEAFPNVEPGESPAGNMILFQLRQPKAVSAGGIIIDTELRKTELDNNQVAKVIAIGPLAFHNRNSGEPWPEGSWAQVGSFVRIPKYAGDRFIRPYTRTEFRVDEKTGERIESEARDEVHFVYMKDLAIIALIDDPLVVRAFL